MEPTTAIATTDFNPEKVALIINDLPSVLDLNKKSVENASAAAQALLDTIEAEGMNEELDKKSNHTLVKLRSTHEVMQTKRKPGTGFMDFIKGEFTKLEAIVYNPKDPKGFYARIQKHRDDFATKKANDQREREQAAARKLAIDKEKISLKSDCELKLQQHFLDFLQQQKIILNNVLEALTLENLENETSRIRAFPATYDHKHYDQFNPSLNRIYLTPEDVAQILIDVKKGKYGDYNSQFDSEITAYKHELLDKIPSKKAELLALAEAKRKTDEADKAAALAKGKKAKEEAEAKAKAAAEETKRLADESAKRKANEEDRMRAEAASKSQAASSTSEANKQASMTEALFDAQQTMSAGEQSSAQVRESFEIEILNPLGYLLIAQFYFEKEGITEDITKLEKKTLGSMKKFCEAYAMKHDEKISSPHLVYKEKFKTVAKKA